MVDTLQCTYCEMKFESTYKLIPHIFLGHRKKILKKINKKEDVLFKCPVNCGEVMKASHNFSSACKQDETFITWLSGALVPLEQHSNIHTKEPKATRCEYCNIELGETIYWYHLQIHMSAKIENPSAPTTPAPVTTPSKQEELKLPNTTPKGRPPSPPPMSGRGRPPSPPPPKRPTTPPEIGVLQNRPPSPPGPPPEYSPPGSPPLQTAKAPEELAASTIPFSSFFKKKSASPEGKMKSIYSDSSSGVSSLSSLSILTGSSSLTSTVSSLTSLSTSSLSPSFKHLETTSSSLLSPSMKHLETSSSSLLSPSRLVDSSSLSRTSLLDSIPSSTSFKSLSDSFGTSSITESRSDSLLTATKESETKATTPTVTTTPKPKMSLSEYAKLRKRLKSEDSKDKDSTEKSKDTTTENIDKESSKEVETVKESLDPATEEPKVDTNEPPTAVPAVAAERKLSVESHEVQELTKQRNKSGGLSEYPRLGPRRRSTDMVSPQLGSSTETAGQTKLITPKPVEAAMRPPTPLDQPLTPTATTPSSGIGRPTTPISAGPGQPTTPLGVPPSSEGSSRSTTPGLSRPTTPHDRSRRTSSDTRTRRLSDNMAPLKEKHKPVLTEEMERQIIFGGALLKGTKLKTPESTQKTSPRTAETTPTDKISPKTTPTQERLMTPTDKVSPRTTPGDKEDLGKEDKSSRESSISPDPEDPEERARREREERERKRKAEERDKMTREQKLAQVRKEIEMRFQEEEIKRMRDKEAQKKYEADLREKIRIEEEKLRKEREKIASEKKRAKEEKRKSKKSKRKRKYSEDDRRSSEDEPDSKRERKSEERSRKSQSLEKDAEKAEILLVEEEPKVVERAKSPDQYEKLKLNFLSKQKEALEKELKLLEQQVGEKQKMLAADDKQEQDENDQQGGQEAAADKMEVDQEEMEEDEDDLEAMMRSYMEKEKEQSSTQVEAVSSLSKLMSNYEDVDDNNIIQDVEQMEEPIEVLDEENDIEAAPINIDAEEEKTDTTTTEPVATVTVDEVQTEADVIQIVDDAVPSTTPEMDEETLAAAKNAAMDIMAPAKRSKRMKAASQLHCSLCKEEEGSSTSYISAYQLLSHVYLVHRKKILARSRKVRGMTLSCPEGCGYITNMSKDGTSIDYFTDELPKHLDMLCEHIRDCHTGEPEMETCQYCSLPLQHTQNWSWQHLANHRNIQRFYCDGCNNFPFKNEVHKCPGSGLETYQAAISDNVPSDAGMRRKRNMSEDEILGKSLDDLERENDVASGHHASRQVKTLGNLVRFMCGVCDKIVTCLSAWLLHIRLDHLGRGHINYSHDIRCFCCPWMPPRFEKGREIIGVNNLVQHMITDHHSEDWKDAEFTLESSKLIQLQREMERRLEREREESAIQVPSRLPAPCHTCHMPLGTGKLWRYHVLAHKFGEVFCSKCRTFILGHHFMEHTATCNAADQNKVKVKIDKYRADTFIETLDGQQRYKVGYEYDRIEGVGSVTIARTMIGTRVVVGNGSTHEEATRAVKEEVENILTEIKLKDEEARKEEIEREDRQQLLDLVRSLIQKDKEEEKKKYYLEDADGTQLPVATRFYFTKTGKVRIQAAIKLMSRGGLVITALGDCRLNAVHNLADSVKEAVSQDGTNFGGQGVNGNGESADLEIIGEFTCVDCNTTFKKDYTYNLHRTQPCIILRP